MGGQVSQANAQAMEAKQEKEFQVTFCVMEATGDLSQEAGGQDSTVMVGTQGGQEAAAE